MALVIYTSVNRETGSDIYRQQIEDSVYFNPEEGYYWHLFSLFKRLEKDTGKLIDLYEGAIFDGSDLAVLRNYLELELVEAKELPEEFNVKVGEKPDGESVVDLISRHNLSKILMKFIFLVKSAEDSNEIIVCWGD